MNPIATCIVGLVSGFAAAPDTQPATRPVADARNVRSGSIIPDEGYCDQPYVVITKDGGWLCTLTTGRGREGQVGQHVVATISRDHGRTWSPLIDIEPADGPEASWVMPLVTPTGRVYAFYIYNGDRVDTLRSKRIRADMLGWYVYKYSDDGGRTWSPRHRLPVRVTACDRGNDWAGRVQILWGIGEPVTTPAGTYFGFTKLGRYMLDEGEGWFFFSPNVLTQRDPERITWTMLPDGEHGVRAPAFGSVQEEHNLVPLSEPGGLYCIYRTTTGHPCHAYSRDGGRTWTPPAFATYEPGGRRIKHPRACPRLWRTRDGRYLLWFHNHGGKDFDGRNPAWIAGGIERDGHIHWSQPEILLYDPDPWTRMSYPDFIEQDGRYWVTETQKEIARVHEIDADLLAGLWSQHAVTTPTRRGLVLRWPADGSNAASRPDAPAMPRLPDLRTGGGFTLDLWLDTRSLPADDVLLDSRNDRGAGLALAWTARHTLRIELADGTNAAAWECDEGALRDDRLHHAAVIVDGGPKIVTFVIDGTLCDGGHSRPAGWTRFPTALGGATGGSMLRLSPTARRAICNLRIYDRYLRTSEAIANFHAGST